MRAPTFREALSHAWTLVWHNKILWVFGLLSVFIGQFGLNNFIGQMAAVAQGNYWIFDFGKTSNFASLLAGHNWVYVLWLFIILAGLFVAILLPVVASEGALIAIAADWYKKKKTLNFNGAWRRGIKHFWRLLAIALLRKLLLFALLFVLNWLAFEFLTAKSFAGQMLFMAALMLEVFLAIVAGVVAIYSAGYVVVDEDSLWVAFRKGLYLFGRHILVSLELSLVLLAINLALILGVVLLSVWFLAPWALFTLTAGFTGAYSLVNVGLAVSLILFIIFLAWVGAVFNAFLTCSWIYFFMRMHHEGIISRFVHWAGRLFRRA